MAKRITIHEIDKFREKLELTETNDPYILEQKQIVVASLKNICDQMEFRGEKYMRIKEKEKEV